MGVFCDVCGGEFNSKNLQEGAVRSKKENQISHRIEMADCSIQLNILLLPFTRGNEAISFYHAFFSHWFIYFLLSSVTDIYNYPTLYDPQFFSQCQIQHHLPRRIFRPPWLVDSDTKYFSSITLNMGTYPGNPPPSKVLRHIIQTNGG